MLAFVKDHYTEMAGTEFELTFENISSFLRDKKKELFGEKHPDTVSNESSDESNIEMNDATVKNEKSDITCIQSGEISKADAIIGELDKISADLKSTKTENEKLIKIKGLYHFLKNFFPHHSNTNFGKENQSQIQRSCSLINDKSECNIKCNMKSLSNGF